MAYRFLVTFNYGLLKKKKATSKPSTKFQVSSDVATAQLPQPTPSNAPSVLTSHQTSVPTGPPTSSTTTHYPAEPYHTTLTPPPGQPPPPSTILSPTHVDPPHPPSAPSSAPTGPPTSPMPHTSPTVARVPHDEVFTNTRATTATSEINNNTVNPNSILGRWFTTLRDPLHCPTLLLGGQYLKGSPSYAIDEFIDCLRHNVCPRVLRLQNINMSDAQVRTLLDVLPTTYIYAVNLGEVELDTRTRQHLCSSIPQSHLVQIWLKDLFDTRLRKHILQLLELNRTKVAAFFNRRDESIPEHECTMWKRLKSANPVSQSSQKQSADPSPHANSNDAPSPPLSKKARPSISSSVTTDKKPKTKPSKRSSKHATSVSATQRRLDTYLVPTAVPTPAPTQQASTGY